MPSICLPLFCLVSYQSYNQYNIYMFLFIILNALIIFSVHILMAIRVTQQIFLMVTIRIYCDFNSKLHCTSIRLMIYLIFWKISVIITSRFLWQISEFGNCIETKPVKTWIWNIAHLFRGIAFKITKFTERIWRTILRGCLIIYSLNCFKSKNINWMIQHR